jgi:hypothetical protein
LSEEKELKEKVVLIEERDNGGGIFRRGRRKG